MGCEGAKHLSKGSWTKLSWFRICNICADYSGKNRIRFDGFTAISNTQLDGLKYLSASWMLDQLPPIAAISLVASNVAYKSKAYFINLTLRSAANLPTLSNPSS